MGLVKFVPVTTSENAGFPATAKVGLTAVMVGAPRIVNVAGADTVPCAGATVMLAVPGLAIRDAEMSAFTRVALTKVVVSCAPFQRTRVPLSKSVPFT